METTKELMKEELANLGFIITTSNIRRPYHRYSECIDIAVHRNLCPNGGIDIAKMDKIQVIDNHVLEDVYKKCQDLGLIKK